LKVTKVVHLIQREDFISAVPKLLMHLLFKYISEYEKKNRYNFSLEITALRGAGLPQKNEAKKSHGLPVTLRATEDFIPPQYST
jgi:hypothetical protein